MNNVLKLTLLCLKNDSYSFWGGLWHSPGATQARPMASGTEFETADLDSVINVIGLTPSDPLDTFVEIWYQVFLWALFSSLFVHFVAAVVAFSMLRKQQIGRFTPLLILLMGLVAPLTGGALTSAVIAGVYRAARFHMMPFYALVWGCGQTVFAVVMSYTRVLATLWPCFWMTRRRGLARMSVLCTSEEETASTSSVATCLAQLCSPSCHPTNALSCSPCYLFMCAPAVCVVQRRGCVIVCHFQLTQPTGSWSVVWPFAATLAWCFLMSDVIFFFFLMLSVRWSSVRLFLVHWPQPWSREMFGIVPMRRNPLCGCHAVFLSYALCMVQSTPARHCGDIVVCQKENDCHQLWSAGTIMWLVPLWEHHPTIHCLHKRVKLLVSFCEFLVKTVLLHVVRFVAMWHRDTASWNREFLELVMLLAVTALNEYTNWWACRVHLRLLWSISCHGSTVMALLSWAQRNGH